MLMYDLMCDVDITAVAQVLVRVKASLRVRTVCGLQLVISP